MSVCFTTQEQLSLLQWPWDSVLPYDLTGLDSRLSTQANSRLSKRLAESKERDQRLALQNLRYCQMDWQWAMATTWKVSNCRSKLCLGCKKASMSHTGLPNWLCHMEAILRSQANSLCFNSLPISRNFSKAVPLILSGNWLSLEIIMLKEGKGSQCVIYDI